jgi:glutamate-1-semialdehyde 2,1-aminomutase
LGIQADIVTYGKVLGGGLPVGAFAAGHEIMAYLAPEGPLYQAGTLSGNPLAMAAGFAMLKTLNENPEIFDRLDKKTETLHFGMQEILEKKGIPYQINRFGSMLSLHFTDQTVIDFKTAALVNNGDFKRYFHGMLEQGIYLPPSAFESYFLNDALSYDDIEKAITALQSVMARW